MSERSEKLGETSVIYLNFLFDLIWFWSLTVGNSPKKQEFSVTAHYKNMTKEN